MKLALTFAVLVTLAVSQANAQTTDSVPATPAPEPVAISDSVPAGSASEADYSDSVVESTIIESRPVMSPRRRSRTRYSSRDTFFGRMMELERRKNAWLMRTFFGR